MVPDQQTDLLQKAAEGRAALVREIGKIGVEI